MNPKQFNRSLLLFLFFFCSGFAQNTLSSVQRELDRVEREIEREKELHLQEKKQAQAFEKSRKTKIAALQKQLENSKTNVIAYQKKVQSQKNRKFRLQKQIQDYKNRESTLRDSVLSLAKEARIVIEKDFPWKLKDRLRDIDALITALEKQSISSEEGMNRLFAVFSNSIQAGYQTELYTASFAQGGEHSGTGTFLRLGTVLQIYLSADEKKAAYLKRNTQGEYVWEQELTPEIRSSIVRAIRIAKGQDAPDLVQLPLPVESIQK